MCKRRLLASPIVVLATMIMLAKGRAWSESLPKVQFAQVPIVAGAPIRFSSLPSELSRSVVRNIIQDDQGFLWFGKREGLWRYDGYRFIRVPSDSPDPSGASGVYVYTLHKDRLGRLWIGFDDSLDRYDPSTGKIQQYRAPAGDPCGALGPVFQISEDREGILWLATESGLKRLDPMTSKVTCYQHEQGDNSSIASNLVRSTLESKNGTFWVANAKGLDIFDRHTGKVTRHFLWQPLSGERIKGASPSTSLVEDRTGLIWQGLSLGGGLTSIDPVTGNVTVYSFRSPNSKRNITYGVVAILQDDEGALWLGTDGQGVLKLDRDRRQAVQYRNDPNRSDSLSNDNVVALFTDHGGSFWVSTEGGYVDRFSSRPPIFRNYRHQSGNPNSLIDDFVISAYEDSHGTLWVGTERGLNRIDQRTGEVIRYESGARGLVEPFKTGVRSIVEDRNGNIWFGSRGSGLERFDPQSGQTRTYRHVPSDPNSLSEDYIASLFVDHRGTLWAATNDGLNRFDPERQQFRFYRAEVAGLVRYHSIAEDSQGALWLGSFGFGVHRFDPQTGSFTVYQNKSGDAHSLTSDRVNSIYIDRAGTLWAATYSGLNKFDPTSHTFTSYHVNDGLPSDAIFGILEDGHGDLWLSTSAGLARFNPRSVTFTYYGISDGVSTDLFSPLVVASTSRTGEMFFGTYSGLVTFFPSQVVDPASVPPVVLTDFRLFGVSVQVGTGPLKQPVWSTRALTLPERSIFSVEFSALSYSDPERNRYRYRLEGLENKWNETDSSHRYAAYSNLAPGQYLFRVQGSDSHGVWNTTGASVQIRVLASFYRTNWFRALCVLTFLAMLWTLHRLRLRQQAYQFNMRLEERVSERTRIARDLHDTLLQSFHGLLLRFQAVCNLLPERPAEAKERLESAIDQAAEAITEGRDAVQGLRSSTVETNDLAVAIRTLGEELAAAETNPNAAVFHVQVEGTPRDLHPILRDEVYRLAGEALRNAFRHAQARKIEVEIRYDEKQFRLRVRDDGKGIDPKVVGGGGREGHYGLHGMRERAKIAGGKLTVWSELNSGTEVELSIPASAAYATSPAGRRSWLSEKLSGKGTVMKS